MYYAYILYSQQIDKYYVGSTNNLKRRLLDHNRGKNKYTKKAGDWQLKFFEVFETRSQAYTQEQKIKKQKSRKYIESLISSAG